MIAAPQHERLPEVLREIVDHDRAIAAEAAEPVVDLAFYRRLTTSRTVWRGLAERRWGYQLGGDGGPVTA